jgi:two-component sensor histidine kinase
MKKSITEQSKLKKRIEELELEVMRLKKKLNQVSEIGNTISVPKSFDSIFGEAQATVKEFFKDIDFNPSKGTITINEDRYVLIRASSLSYGFFKQINLMYSDVGADEAFNIGQNFLFDIGHVIGIKDASQFHKKMGLKDALKKLATGPIHFAYSGWAYVEILEDSNPTPDENFFLRYNHPYSFEADSWIKKGEKSDQPVCIMNAAYSSGWCEQSYGIKLTAVEISCRAKGDETCTFIMAPPDKIEGYLSDQGHQIPKRHKIPVFFERKHIEGAMKKSLAEKETLLKEIHHRVKNNLQIISSLLNLQFQNIDDESVRNAISKSKDRINSMALIHTKLYQSSNLTSIDFGVYLDDLIKSIASSYSINDNINCSVKCIAAHFDIDLCINLGLIITELLTNAYKHAFVGEKSGLIKVELRSLKEEMFQLIIEDNGIGIPDHINLEKRESLGIEIVEALTGQIEGTIDTIFDKGLKYTITFKQ